MIECAAARYFFRWHRLMMRADQQNAHKNRQFGHWSQNFNIKKPKILTGIIFTEAGNLKKGEQL